MKFDASHIVVDADIARSSGLSEHPVSRSSRELLKSILNSNIDVAFCPTLLAEWKKHNSLFAKRWLSSMFAKSRVYRITPPEVIKTEIHINPVIKYRTHHAA